MGFKRKGSRLVPVGTELQYHGYAHSSDSRLHLIHLHLKTPHWSKNNGSTMSTGNVYIYFIPKKLCATNKHSYIFTSVFIYQLAKWYPKSLIKNISIYIKEGIFPVNSFLHECLLRSFQSMSNSLDGTDFTGHIHLLFRPCSIQLHNISPLLGQLVSKGGVGDVWSSCLGSYSAPLIVGLFSHIRIHKCAT